MTPVVGLDVVGEATVEIFIIDDGESDLTSSSGGDDDGNQGVANSGEPPDEAENQGGDDEELHVNSHVPRDIHTVGLTRAVNILGVIIDVEEIEPPALLAFIHTGIDKL